MYVLTDNDNQIIQLVSIGSLPDDGFQIPDDTPTEILQNIFDYKFIDGNFVKNDNADLEKLDKLKIAKIKAMSTICTQVITSGFDFNGEHYSLQQHDQINLAGLKNAALNNEPVVYHSDGNLCRIYQPDELLLIVQKAEDFKNFHTTYFNFLKSTILGMSDINDVISVSYGSPISKNLKSEFQSIIGDTHFDIPEVPDTTDYSSLLHCVDLDNLKNEVKSNEENN